MTTAAELASYASSFPSFRNRIINGDMRIDQRNGGSSYSFAHDGTTNGYTLDRFQFTLVNSDEFDCTITQYSMSSSEIATTGHSNALKLLTGTAETTVGNDEYVRIIQRVEAQNLQDLKHGTASAKPSILSFWVKSSEEGTYGLNLYRYVRSGSARNINLSYKIDVADTWEHKTIPISGDTGGDLIPDTNENGLFINWQLAAGSNYNSTASTSWADYASTRAFGNYSNSVATTASATWYITGVQLEEGTVGTEFEHRPIGVELALCQRYYQKSFPMDVAPAQNIGGNGALYCQGHAANAPASGFVIFPTPMRDTPSTLLTFNPSATNGKWRNLNTSTDINQAIYSSSSSGFFLYSNTQVLSQYEVAAIHWSAHAEL